MTPDWTKLAPHRPLDPGADAYQPAPGQHADAIAKWVLAGGSTVLVGGPAGVGKSTELAQVAKKLQDDRVACFVPVDRWENMRRITPDRLLLHIAGKLVHMAIVHLSLPVSHDLRAILWRAGVLSEELLEQPAPGLFSVVPSDIARLAINEVARLSRTGRVALVLDGLEKVPEGPLALEVFDALAALPDDVDIVTVVPWHVAFGPQAAEPVIRAGERFVSVRAPEVEGDVGEAGRAFLRGVLTRRLGTPSDTFDPGPSPSRVASAWLGDTLAPASTAEMVEQAAVLSGGVSRTFLQILADAGTYARLRHATPWPDDTDLADAIADQQDSLRRILLPGDRGLLQRFDGSDGLEMDVPAKVRFLAHGLMLEREQHRRVVLRMHPLVTSIVGGNHA
jgi:hypothetical protein